VKNLVKINKKGRTIVIEGVFSENVKNIRIDVFSNRNLQISKISGISPNHPTLKKNNSQLPDDEYSKRFLDDFSYSDNAELWYPVVDFEIQEDMRAKVIFDKETKGNYAINGMFYRENKAFEETIEIEGNKLEYWENSLFLQPASITPREFFICIQKTIEDLGNNTFSYTLNLLSNDWEGKIKVSTIDKEAVTEVAEVIIRNDLEKKEEPEDRNLQNALKHSIEYILGSQNSNPQSLTYKGLYLFYDLEAKTYRTTTWIWSWGPCVKLLLDSANSSLLDNAFDKDFLMDKANEIGLKSTEFQVNRPDHITDGLGSGRWDPKHFSGVYNNYGYIELLAGGADSNFLSGWAWIPLYKATKNSRYLECAKKLAETTGRLIHLYDIIPQDYIPEINEWTDRTLNESVFGMEGLAELYLLTKDERIKEIGKKYIDQHVEKLHRKDGLWDFSYFTKTGERVLIKNTRGLGWAMMGLLAANKMLPDREYLDMAIKLASRIIEYQAEEGYVTCVFDEPVEKVGIDDKSTPLWSLLLYRLFKFTNREEHLTAARKALNWCIENQYLGTEENAKGGFVGVNKFSGIVNREWYPMTCLYSTAFFGLALLEENEIRKAVQPGCIDLM
jgi:hypothetical protein